MQEQPSPLHKSPLPQVLRSLNKTYRNMKQKPVTVDLDPKAVTCDELFGIIHPATREWKDGETTRMARAVPGWCLAHTASKQAVCVHKQTPSGMHL